MSSFINKFANSVTSGTSSLIGRDKVTRLTNSINKGLFRGSKYRDYMKLGNTVQLISRTSRMSLHICISQNDSSRLILLGNGQVGPEALNSHFVIEKDKNSSHLKFKNGNNYVAFDNEIPCILSEPTNPRSKAEQIRARNEFRLVEILGSEEYFCLESVYYPGRFLAVLQDGAITHSRNRAEEKAHFCLNVIHVMPEPGKPILIGDGPATPYMPVNQGIMPAPGPGVGASARPMSFSVQNQNDENNHINYNFNSNNQSFKAGEAAAAAAQSEYGTSSSSGGEAPPPVYSNIFPSLPKMKD